MKKHILIVTAAIALAFGAHAKTYNLPKDEPLASVAVPASWKVEAEEDSLTATSKDGDIEFSMEVLDADQIDGAIDENLGYLKKNKVEVDAKSIKKSEGKMGELEAHCVSMMGKDEDGVCNISLFFVKINSKKFISVLYWAPEKVEQSDRDDIDSILKSFEKK
jgi:hypothetical protein